MKKIIFAALAVLLILSAIIIPAYASEVSEELTVEDISAYVEPSEDEVRNKIIALVEKYDGTLSGIRTWEDAKTWVMDNLSTVVGFITALSAMIIGLATKFSWVPKIVKAVKQLFAAVGKWCTENTDKLRDYGVKLDGFFDSILPLIKETRERARENASLRRECVALYRDYIMTRERADATNTALLEYMRLQAEEMEELIQSSPLTKADLDAHYEKFKTKKQLIDDRLSLALTPTVAAVPAYDSEIALSNNDKEVM